MSCTRPTYMLKEFLLKSKEGANMKKLIIIIVLLDNLDYLTEDIYIFDESFNWTFALTHEYLIIRDGV